MSSSVLYYTNNLEILFRNPVILEELYLSHYLIQQHYFGLYSSSTKPEILKIPKDIIKRLVVSIKKIGKTLSKIIRNKVRNSTLPSIKIFSTQFNI